MALSSQIRELDNQPCKVCVLDKNLMHVPLCTPLLLEPSSLCCLSLAMQHQRAIDALDAERDGSAEG